MARIRKHDSRNIDDHIVAEGHGVELGAEAAPVKDINWNVKSAEVHADPMEDLGTGQKVIARRFNFQRPPGIEQISHEELLEWHKKHTVIPTLWKDELELIDEPRIIAGKKGAFTIVALCAPRTVLGVRSQIHEHANTVQGILQQNG
jgi:hypothetical protein